MEINKKASQEELFELYNYLQANPIIKDKRLEDMTGLLIGEWEVLCYVGKRYWLCRCSCGTLKLVEGKSLKTGQSKSCGHDTKTVKNLKGQLIKGWEVIEYVPDYHWKVRCTTCGQERVTDSYSLTTSRIGLCSHSDKDARLLDIKGQQFGEWTVLEYAGDKYWKCRCSCGKEQLVLGKELRAGRTKSCGHYDKNKVEIRNLIGQQFGEWKVLEYSGYGRWKCRCSCGKESEVIGKLMISGHSKSCGHNTNAFQNLTNKQFGELTAIEYLGNRQWKCRCSCGKECTVYTQMLTSKKTTSCGHDRAEKIKKILLERYNETATSRINNPRKMWQIETLESPEKLKEFILNMGYKPATWELEKLLNIGQATILKRIHKYKLDELVDIQPSYSEGEIELYNYIKSISKYEVVHSNRTILQGKELDIYIPELKLAFEYNGIYWHSATVKGEHYHQQKTIECAKRGIRLIHIFEHEWNNELQKTKLLNYIKELVNKDNKIVYARNTKVKIIDNSISYEFLNKYHLQNGCNASINIGCYTLDNELLGVLTLGKPRFNNKYQYEIYRMCWKPGVTVTGGTSKMFKEFIKKYDPTSIITYSDISKFTGNVYTSLGFKPVQPNPITAPNYVWVDAHFEDILTRYQTQKHKLIEEGLGTPDQTEDEIMEGLNFFKIYDSGNIKLEWLKGNQ